VPHLRISTNTFKIFKIEKDEICMVLNIITALQIKQKGYIIHFIAILQIAYSFGTGITVVSVKIV